VVFTILLESGTIDEDFHARILGNLRPWTPPPPKDPSKLTNAELTAILRPIYAEMETQKPPEVEERRSQSCECFFSNCSHSSPIYYN
jgi:hypothetical protein